MALQKRHVGWIGRAPEPPEGLERRRPRRAFRDFWPWFLGFMLVNSVPVFQYLALMGLTTNVVGAIAGTSVAFTTLLAWAFLRERLGAGRLAWSVALFGAIAAAGFLGEGGASGAEGFSPAALFVALGLPLLGGAALFAARFRWKGPRLAAAIAAFSGCLGGFMVFPLRALQVAAMPTIAGWLSSPYFYALL